MIHRADYVPSSHDLICVICGAEFTNRMSHAMYCSSLCRSRAFNAARKADGRLKAQRIKDQANRSAWAKSAKESRTCEACGATFKVYRYAPTTHCSQTCAQQMRRGLCRLPSSHPAIVLVRKAMRVWVMGWCLRCGKPFVILNQMTVRYCSPRCGSADAKDRRNAIKRRAFIENVYRNRIFERDKWTCKLCGKRVKRKAVVPDPKAPTIDHILPLALGGTHEPWNVQCAHFLCNSLKSDRLYLGRPEQLTLSAV